MKRWFLRLWYWNRSTKIRLWHTDTIGYYEGYFECNTEVHEYLMQYYEDVKNMSTKEANALLHERSERVQQKYFGPKWIRA